MWFIVFLFIAGNSFADVITKESATEIRIDKDTISPPDEIVALINLKSQLSRANQRVTNAENYLTEAKDERDKLQTKVNEAVALGVVETVEVIEE